MAGVTIVGALGLAALLLTTFVGAQEQAPKTLAGLSLELLTRGGPAVNRSEFAVCVDAAGGETVERADIEMVRRAVDDAFADAPEIPHTVAQGCPSAVGLTGKRLDEHQRQGYEFPSRRIQPPNSPSPFAIAVYIVPPDVYEASFQVAYPYATTTEEVVCEGDRCAGVTGGLYVTRAITEDQLLYAFLDVQGVVPDPLRACMGEAVARPSWCDVFWQEVGLAPPD
jgi:hypothetical protein